MHELNHRIVVNEAGLNRALALFRGPTDHQAAAAMPITNEYAAALMMMWQAGQVPNNISITALEHAPASVLAFITSGAGFIVRAEETPHPVPPGPIAGLEYIEPVGLVGNQAWEAL